MSMAGWIIAHFFRWLPHAVPTGLFPLGTPDADSPVIVTANFSLTVSRVRRALEGRNLWLLVANSDGINVWCAAAGGAFTAHRVIDAIKVSRLSDRVSHREVILPALSAPGTDRKVIKDETGFRAYLGPVYAADIPAYLAAGMKKTEPMRRFRFDFKHRLDMFLSMNFPIYLVVAVVVGIFWPRYLAGTTALFWGALAALYLLVDVIPGKTGWGQAAFAATTFVAGWAPFSGTRPRARSRLSATNARAAASATIFARWASLAGLTRTIKRPSETAMRASRAELASRSVPSRPSP